MQSDINLPTSSESRISQQQTKPNGLPFYLQISHFASLTSFQVFLGLPIGLTPTNSLVICVLLQPYTLSPFVTQPYHRYLICCNTAAISSSPTRNLSVNFTLPIHLQVFIFALDNATSFSFLPAKFCYHVT